VNDVSPGCWERRLFEGEIDAALVYGPKIFCRLIRPHPCCDIVEWTGARKPRLQAVGCVDQNVFIFFERSGVAVLATGQFPNWPASASPAPQARQAQPAELARAARLVIVLMTEWHCANRGRPLGPQTAAKPEGVYTLPPSRAKSWACWPSSCCTGEHRQGGADRTGRHHVLSCFSEGRLRRYRIDNLQARCLMLGLLAGGTHVGREARRSLFRCRDGCKRRSTDRPCTGTCVGTEQIQIWS
jgi:hypothetical protein